MAQIGYSVRGIHKASPFGTSCLVPPPALAAMPKKPKQRRTKRAPNVIRATPNKPEARDEGPRLIPLGNEYQDAKTEYYLRLSNLALGLTEKKS